MRKVMRLGSGRERRRCIMQFSLAAGSESAVRERKKMSNRIMAGQIFNSLALISSRWGDFDSLVKL